MRIYISLIILTLAICAGCSEKPNLMSVTVEIDADKEVLDKFEQGLYRFGVKKGGRVRDEKNNVEIRNFFTNDLQMGVTYIGFDPKLDMSLHMSNNSFAPDEFALKILNFFCETALKLRKEGKSIKTSGFESEKLGGACKQISS